MIPEEREKLKQEWTRYKNVHGCTQAEVSKQLGWAPATLGLYLTGRRKLKTEHLYQLADLFNCDPLSLDSKAIRSVREYDVICTVSGNPPPHARKSVRNFPNSQVIYCDQPVLIEGATLAIPAGVSLVVEPPETMQNDRIWPAMDKKYWVVRSRTGAIKLVLSEDKPKISKSDTLYHILATLFF